MAINLLLLNIYFLTKLLINWSLKASSYYYTGVIYKRALPLFCQAGDGRLAFNSNSL